jgi:DNA-binding transcriptional regulator/RsmH inhibitor MraZ
LEHLFTGSALCTVSGDGHFVLPTFARTVLARRSDAGRLTFGRHELDPCLIAYNRQHGCLIHADLERRRLAGADGDRRASRRAFGQAEEVALSPSGMVAIPAMLRELGGIRLSALLIGAGGTFEIWNPQDALESEDGFLSEMAAWRLGRQSEVFQ